MQLPSAGKIRGLQQISDARGVITVCAIDHRGSLKHALNPENPGAVGYREMVEFKLDLCRVLADHVSAVLLDPEYGAGQAVSAGVLPGRTGLLVSLEKTGYTGGATARRTEILPDWSVGKIKRMGASAVKLLIYFRYDLKREAEKQLDLVARVAERCLDEDIPLLVESVSYPLAAEAGDPQEYSKKKPGLVIEAARRLTALPIDILKAEFPADINFEKDEVRLKDYCRELTRTSQLPWVLLSAGANFDVFRKEVSLACRAGASGFMAGRALWQEACAIKSREARQDFLGGTTLERLKEIAGIADRYARPWHYGLTGKNGGFRPVPEGWYRNYASERTQEAGGGAV
jgi:tagatose 1,6-diphosphate aldolase